MMRIRAPGRRSALKMGDRDFQWDVTPCARRSFADSEASETCQSACLDRPGVKNCVPSGTCTEHYATDTVIAAISMPPQKGCLPGQPGSGLNVPRVPNRMEALASTHRITVRSRSSTKTFTCGLSVRAVTLQSMLRMSSPGRYSRTS